MLTSTEKKAIDAHRQGRDESANAGSEIDLDAWLEFGIKVLLGAGRMVRDARYSALQETVRYKTDGSPSLRVEHEIEEKLRRRLAIFAPDAGVLGEESGGALSQTGIVIVIDPVDGTWSLLNRSETHAASLAFFENGEVFLGMVSNPATGEIAYALANQPTRLIQLSLFGESDDSFELPIHQTDSSKLLVNVHPARGVGSLVAELFKAWSQGDVQMVKAPGGSPAWALLEAAKGTFAYVNMWPGKPADPFDLAAAVKLVRGAGGDVLGADRQPITMSGHQGPFVAGINRNHCLELVKVLESMRK
jgi:fructose-1,6-bisphosphatase/inositol monophosphatase family enzyme